MSPLRGTRNALLSLQKPRISVRAVQLMVKKYATTQAAPLKKHLSPHCCAPRSAPTSTGDGRHLPVADVLGHSDANTTRRHYAAAMADERRRWRAAQVKLREDGESEPPDDKI